MGENNIIAGNSSFKKIMKIATLISCVITVMSLALVILIPILMDKTREYMRENSIYLGGDLSLDIQKRVKRLYTLYVLREWNTQLLPLSSGCNAGYCCRSFGVFGDFLEYARGHFL